MSAKFPRGGGGGGAGPFLARSLRVKQFGSSLVGPDLDPNCLKCYKQNTLACKELLKINCLLLSLPIHCSQPLTRGSAHPDKNKTPRSRYYLSASFEHISKTECFVIYSKNIVVPYSCNLQMTHMF